MANEIQIANLALSRLGGYRIQSFSDATKEAREASLHYPLMRDSVLEDHDWDFARKRTLLALLATTYTGWAYAYQYPIDCLVARSIISSVDANGISQFSEETGLPSAGKAEYEVISNAAMNSRVILTDKASAELVYTGKVTDANMFSPLFVNALAWRLASDLAIPLKGKADLHNSLYALYTAELSKAKASMANQGFSAPDQTFQQSRA